MKTFLTACLLLLATSAFAQPRPGAFTTLFTTGFGTPIVASAGGAGSNSLVIRNTTAGTANDARLIIGNDTDASLTSLVSYASTYTSGGGFQANGTTLYSNGVGGLSLMGGNAAGAVRIYSGGNNERARIFASGGVSIGNTTDPGAASLRVVGNLSVGTGNITDFVGTPTIASGFGGGSIAGTNFAFIVTAGGGTTGTVAFSSAYTSAPVCVASLGTSGSIQAVNVSTSTTQVILTLPVGAGAGDKFYVLCRGY